MRTTTPRLLALLLAPLLLAAAGSARVLAPAPALHLQLVRSAPAADSVVAPPSELRLWFSQAPQQGATSVRLTDAAGEPVELGEIAPDTADPKVFAAPLPAPLAPGAYSVAWRTMAADGHVVRDTFGFRVVPVPPPAH